MNAFGDDRLYLEKYLDRPHHVEIQIFADAHGRSSLLVSANVPSNGPSKGDRGAPSPIVTPDLRKKMSDAAVRLARAGGYVNAGTVEFLVDANLNFYFLEVNTRLQVEHPSRTSYRPRSRKTSDRHRRRPPLPFAWESITPAATPWKFVSTPRIPTIISSLAGKLFRDRFPAAQAFAWMTASTRAGPCPTTTIRFSATHRVGQ